MSTAQCNVNPSLSVTCCLCDFSQVIDKGHPGKEPRIGEEIHSEHSPEEEPVSAGSTVHSSRMK